MFLFVWCQYIYFVDLNYFVFKQPGGGSVSWINGSDYEVKPLLKPVQNEETMKWSHC